MGLIGTASRFDLFASSVMFYQTDMSLFTVIILGVCAVISFLGIGAVTRGGVVFTVIVVLGTVAAVCTTLINEFDFLNFTPLFNERVCRSFSRTDSVFRFFATSFRRFLCSCRKYAEILKRAILLGSGLRLLQCPFWAFAL